MKNLLFLKLGTLCLLFCLSVSCGKASEIQKSDGPVSALNSISVGDMAYLENDMQYELMIQLPAMTSENTVSKNASVSTDQNGKVVATVTITDADLGIQGSSGSVAISFNLNP